jgi:DNA-binding transcriptional LysR family regulator
MPDRFEAMSLLLAVVDHGSLSAAGRVLGVPVATLSRKLTELEAQLGARLLLRTTRKLTLTDAGLAYTEAAQRILDQVEEAERAAAGEFIAPRGELVVTAPILFGRLHLLPVVTDFLGAFPDINVRLVLSDRTIDLVDDHIDMAVRIGALADSAMIATQVGLMRTVACASPALLDRYGVPLTPEDLATLPCVAFDNPYAPSDWRFRRSGSARLVEVAIKPRLSVTTAEAVVESAIRGMGVARVLHYQAAEAMAAGSLKVVLEDFEPPAAPVHLLHAARGRMPLKVRRFLDLAAPRLRQALSGQG